jgi:hemerythrin-like domain-containing protein
MSIDRASPSEIPDTSQMVVIHKILRREITLLPDLVAATPAGDLRRAQLVGSHVTLMFDFLHAHHDSEDRLLWPLLEQRAPLDKTMVSTMRQQHAAVAGQCQELRAHLPTWRVTADPSTGAQLANRLTTLRRALDEHLDLEETAALPIVREHITRAEWNAMVRDAGKHTPTGFRPAMILLGTVLDDISPPERQWFLSEVPAVARLLYRLIGQRIHARNRAALRLPAAPTRPG